jgi:hypothetical protein
MKCPGQDTRYWKPGDIFEIGCPHCGDKVEFFKDEATRRCRGCKNMVVNPKMDLGCASYCQYAAQCLGELGPELLAKQNDLLKDRVALEVKHQLGKDFRKIAHALNVARYAEQIAREEKEAQPALVLCAAYLHVLSESTDQHGGPDGLQTARTILEKLAAGSELIAKVSDVINHVLSGQGDGSASTKVLFDAHLLASLEEKKEGLQGGEAAVAGLGRECLTDTGKTLLSRLHRQVS